MAYERISDTTKIVSGIGVNKRVIHTTGNFVLYLETSRNTHTTDTATGTTITIPASQNNVVNANYQVLKNGTDITNTVTLSGTQNRTVTFATALVSGDNVQIHYDHTNNIYSHTGGGVLRLALENNDYIDPASGVEVSIETDAGAVNTDSSVFHRVY